MKPGRNDPCPCGSGKKYKHCCLAQAAAPAADLLWQRLRRFHDGLPARLVRFADEVFGRAAIEEAWDEFTLWTDTPFDPDSPHIPLFLPWFFYHWTPDPEETEVKPDAPRERTIVAAWLERYGRRLDAIERRSLEASLAGAFSFHEVVRSDPGAGFRLRDLLTGEEQEVIERSASRTVGQGDILLAKVVRVEHLTLLDGVGPVAIPLIEKKPIIELRRKIRSAGGPVTAERLRDYDLEMLDIYHDIAERLLNPAIPALHNTDGDPLVFHKLYYDIESPQTVFDALKDLALDESEEDLLAAAERDAAGALRKVEFSWKVRGNAMHKHWDNTVRGHIVIASGALTVQVNSAARAAEFRTLAEERLAGLARYRTTVIEDAEAMLARNAPDKSSAAPVEMDTDSFMFPASQSTAVASENLESHPEVQAHIAAHLAAHYENWPEQRLPALDDRTPLEAVADPDGREMVEALVTQAERDAHTRFPYLPAEVFARLRARLGLPGAG